MRLLFLLTLLAPPLAAQDDWRARVVPEGLQVLTEEGGAVLETVALPLERAWKVVASPGGKVVFVLHRGIAALTLLDGETRRVSGTVPLPAVPEDLWFSPTGYVVGIAWTGLPASAYLHRQGRLDAAAMAPPPRPEASGPEVLVLLHPDEGYACF